MSRKSKTGLGRLPQKGERAPGSGRKKGTPNKVTLEAREAAALIVDDPEYREGLRQRALEGKLAPALECMLWHYAKGKPVERVAQTDADGNPIDRGVQQLSDAELRRSVAEVVEQWREEGALPQ